ncbi:hypothetical protein [Fulvivirga lutimaris]|uniref:hypothetical protein n=1 Tax=Fulvivirga lutimaris TaxID=1819566 RepID=UPI0012BC4D15|nr:hypothetical protein [Fulvivirga lutimaris]MTI38935.1 hypothetical protein [Fulvivirga lutimaris]
MKKSVKSISLFLGISMFAFGMLKFIDPFKSWYTTQVVMSELPFQQLSYWSGQLGEILSGLIFLLLVLYRHKISPKKLTLSLIINNVAIAFMMLVAFYVHIHPNVLNDVLPLKIKPPFIPAFFFALAILNIWLEKRQYTTNDNNE